jgi:hypothetical protein
MTKAPQDENGYVGGPYGTPRGFARVAEAGQNRWSIQTLRRFAEINRAMPATTRRPP